MRHDNYWNRSPKPRQPVLEQVLRGASWQSQDPQPQGDQGVPSRLNNDMYKTIVIHNNDNNNIIYKNIVNNNIIHNNIVINNFININIVINNIINIKKILIIIFI